MRFYMEEPVWWLISYRDLLTMTKLLAVLGLLPWAIGLSVIRLGAGTDENQILVVLITFGGIVAWFLAFCFIFAMSTWPVAWWLISAVSRWQCSAILRTRGWPAIVLSPRLLRFPAGVWRRLPDYEQMLSTGWCDEWWEGQIAPVNLYATLALLDELDLEWRKGYDGRKTARERIDEAAGTAEAGRFRRFGRRGRH